jgi:SAM-dependent methyltransferase
MTISTHSKAKAGETPTARQRRVWDKMAPTYDKQIALFERIQFGGGREWVCSRAFGRVLEYPAEAHITGIELSPAMLAITRQRATDLGIDADLREGDAEALPFADNSFDTVVCVLSLCTIPDPAKAITEMARVLKPGGKLLLLDHIGSRWWLVWAVQQFLELFSSRSGEYQTRRQLPLLAPAGLHVVESQQLKWGTVERVAATKPAP